MVQTKKERLMAEVGGNIAESTGGQMPAALASRVAPASPAPKPARMQGVERSKNVAEISIDRIMPDPDQPRKEFGEKELERLGDSMKAKGQLQPIRVMWNPEASMYRIIMGERRYRAAIRAGMTTLSCVIHDSPLEPAEVLAIQMIENVHRDDLKPVEQARAVERLKAQFGWNQTRVAQELGVSQASVARMLSLLKLPEDVQERVDSGRIGRMAGHHIARADPASQSRVAESVESGRLTQEETAAVVEVAPKRAGGGKSRSKKSGANPSPAKRTSYAHNFDGIKILATRARGLTEAALLPAAESLVDRLKAAIGAVG
jgi:ParB family chromosome partitioning protein